MDKTTLDQDLEIDQICLEQVKPDRPEKGTTELIMGAGLGTYGTTAFLTTGFLCPACMLIAPALLGVGAYKRMKFVQTELNADTKKIKAELAD